jgi:hypothetical protein
VTEAGSAVNVEVIYAGQTFTIPRRSLADVQSEIDTILLSGVPGWIQVYDGHGARVPTHLLLGPGVPIALAEIGE